MTAGKVFIISVTCLLAFAGFLGAISYWVHEANTPNYERIAEIDAQSAERLAKIEACVKEERVDVRAMCIALTGR